MRPKLQHGSPLDVSEILYQLDHLLDTASVEENSPLQIVEIQLKLRIIVSNIRHKDFRLSVCSSRSDHPPEF